MRPLSRFLLVTCALALQAPLPHAYAQSGQKSQGGVYTCIDGHGRRLSSDRPIPECADREQRVLGNSGIERRRIGPVLTEHERQQQAEALRQQRIEERRLRDQQRRDELLVERFPNQAAHDRERSSQLQQFDDLQAVARARLEELENEYAIARKDMRPYLAEPATAPGPLRNALADAEKNLAVHKRSMEVNEINRQRAILRLDDEQLHLQLLWRQRDEAAAAAGLHEDD